MHSAAIQIILLCVVVQDNEFSLVIQTYFQQEARNSQEQILSVAHSQYI